jgi:hypothetical protein
LFLKRDKAVAAEVFQMDGDDNSGRIIIIKIEISDFIGNSRDQLN